jgi:hypothetical protein
MLSWQQPSESPKTPQISPASPNLATDLAKQQDPKIRPLSHNRTVDETIADERLSVVRLRRSSPGYPPKHT